VTNGDGGRVVLLRGENRRAGAATLLTRARLREPGSANRFASERFSGVTRSIRCEGKLNGLPLGVGRAI
jgi:hypothetical protein